MRSDAVAVEGTLTVVENSTDYDIQLWGKNFTLVGSSGDDRFIFANSDPQVTFKYTVGSGGNDYIDGFGVDMTTDKLQFVTADDKPVAYSLKKDGYNATYITVGQNTITLFGGYTDIESQIINGVGLMKIDGLNVNVDEQGNGYYEISSAADLVTLANFVNNDGVTGGKTFKLTTDISDWSGGNLTVFGQSGGTGALNVTGTIATNTLNFNNGTLTAGTISGTLNFKGGTLTADTISGNVNLDWTQDNDTLTATNFSGTMTVADGKRFYDTAGNIYSGTTSTAPSGQLKVLDGVRLDLPTGVTITSDYTQVGNDIYVKTGATVTLNFDAGLDPTKYRINGALITDAPNNQYTFTMGGDITSVSADQYTFSVNGDNTSCYEDGKLIFTLSGVQNLTSSIINGNVVTLNAENFTGSNVELTALDGEFVFDIPGGKTLNNLSGKLTSRYSSNPSYEYSFKFTLDSEGNTVYAINSIDDLDTFEKYINSANAQLGYLAVGQTFKLTADIDLSGVSNWTPIGNGDKTKFCGTFDGGGHVISNLTSTVSGDTDRNGLFGLINGSGTVKNVTLINVNASGGYTGAIVGYNDGTVTNCTVINATISARYRAGSLVGSNSGTVTNCTYQGNAGAIGTNSGTDSGNEQLYSLTLGDGISAEFTGDNSYKITVNGKTFYKSGATFKLTVDPNKTAQYYKVTGVSGATLNGDNYIATIENADLNIKIAGCPIISGVDFDDTTDTYTIADTQDLIDIATFIGGGGDLSGLTFDFTATEYEIGTLDELQGLAGLVNGGGDTSGLTFKLAQNIGGVNFHIGDSDAHRFKGTFDGNGFAISVNYTSTTENCALFNYVDGATIKKLTVDGTINTSAKFAAGIAARVYGTTTISDCRSSVTINSSVSGDGTHGGFVGVLNDTTNITNCIFDGKLLTTNGTTHCGGFVGWKSGTLNITNSIFAPAEVSIGTSNSATFARNGVNSLSGGYYTQTFNDAQNGTQVYRFAATLPDDVTTDTSFVEIGGSKFIKAGTINLTHNDITYSYNVNSNVTSITTTDSGISINGTALEMPYPYTLETDADGYKLITSVEQLSGLAAYVNAGNNCAGYKFKLTTDIENFTDHIGDSSNHKFAGTLDGDGHKITVKYTATTENCALFNYVDGATIKKLTVDGSITTSKKFAAGIAAQTSGTTNITDCRSSVTINSTVSGDGTHGGLVGVVSGTTNISNCIFDGKLLGESTNSCGGFVGWNGGTLNITDSLFNPTSVSIGASNSATFARNSVNKLDGGYYTQLFNDAQGGTQVYKSLTLPEGVEATATDESTVKFDNKTYYKSGATFKLTVTEQPENQFLKGATHNDDGTYTYTIGNTVTWMDIPKIDGLTFNTDGEYFEIGTAADLNTLASYVTNGHTCDGLTFKLTDTIDMSGVENFTPIGNECGYEFASFKGTFDGAGHTISGLNISYSECNNVGLFRYNFGTIKNLNVSGTVTGTCDIVGGIVGTNKGTLDNVTFSGTVTGTNDTVGGLVGDNDAGTVKNSTFIGTLSGNSNVGGLIGNNGAGTITNNKVDAQITGNSNVGALVGVTQQTVTSSDNYFHSNQTAAFGATEYGGDEIQGTKVYALNLPENTEVSGALELCGKYYAQDGAEVTIDGENYTINADNYSYIDSDGKIKLTSDYTILDGSQTTLNAGWYVVNSDITISNKLTISGEVHLILADGAKLTVNGDTGYGIDGNNYSNKLNIYGQANQSGELEVTSTSNYAIKVYGNITINGGKITANSPSQGISTGHDFIINGGKIIDNSSWGIDSANFNLNLKNADDFIQTNYLYAGGTLTVADGKRFYDQNGNSYSGSAQIGRINNVGQLKLLEGYIIKLPEGVSITGATQIGSSNAYICAENANITLTNFASGEITFDSAITALTKGDNSITATTSDGKTFNISVETSAGSKNWTIAGTSATYSSNFTAAGAYIDGLTIIYQPVEDKTFTINGLKSNLTADELKAGVTIDGNSVTVAESLLDTATDGISISDGYTLDLDATKSEDFIDGGLQTLDNGNVVCLNGAGNTAGWKNIDGVWKYVAASGDKGFELSGIGSIDGISVENGVVTLNQDAFNDDDYNIDLVSNNGGYIFDFTNSYCNYFCGKKIIYNGDNYLKFGGTSSADIFYAINSLDDLQTLCNVTNGTPGNPNWVDTDGLTFKLTADLDLDGGNYCISENNGFNGTFDGNGHSISNISDCLIYNDPKGTVKNLLLINVSTDEPFTTNGNYENVYFYNENNISVHDATRIYKLTLQGVTATGDNVKIFGNDTYAAGAVNFSAKTGYTVQNTAEINSDTTITATLDENNHYVIDNGDGTYQLADKTNTTDYPDLIQVYELTLNGVEVSGGNHLTFNGKNYYFGGSTVTVTAKNGYNYNVDSNSITIDSDTTITATLDDTKHYVFDNGNGYTLATAANTTDYPELTQVYELTLQGVTATGDKLVTNGGKTYATGEITLAAKTGYKFDTSNATIDDNATFTATFDTDTTNHYVLASNTSKFATAADVSDYKYRRRLKFKRKCPDFGRGDFFCHAYNLLDILNEKFYTVQGFQRLIFIKVR